jgi:hypothetical protein
MITGSTNNKAQPAVRKKALREVVWVIFGRQSHFFSAFPGRIGLFSSQRTCHDARMENHKRLVDIYSFPGFIPQPTVRGIFGEPLAVVITLRRCRKKRAAEGADNPTARITTSGPAASATWPVATNTSISTSRSAGSLARSAA